MPQERKIIGERLGYVLNRFSSFLISQGHVSNECDMVNEYHSYGVDIQNDGLTFYYDRREIWRVENSIPGHSDTYDQ